MIPSPTLDKVRNVVIDRRVRLDMVGNVFHSLCSLLQMSAESVLDFYDANGMASPSAFRASSMGICLWAPYSRA